MVKKASASKSSSHQALVALGASIRHERKARRLSQTQLAQLAGVGINFIGQLESGKPTAQIALVISVLTALGRELTLGHGKRGLVIT